MSNSFRTEINLGRRAFQFDLATSFLTVGSCFSQMIGDKLAQNKFQVLSNPFGTVYNPVSLFELLMKSELDESKFIQRDDLWLHHDFHSDFKSSSLDDLRNQLIALKLKVTKSLQEIDCLVITYGTSWVYERQIDQSVVSNCHKTPQKQFNKRLLWMKEMSQIQDKFIDYIHERNPNIHILLTVSPVRHIKDGITENQLSKSMLRVLCDFATSSYDHVSYFPSYEIMMDDLRDYRFYKDDMIHPNSFAENYIWEKYKEAYLNRETNEFVDKWSKILSAIRHRPFNPESVAHQKFLKYHIELLEELSDKVDVSGELSHLRGQLR